MNPKRIALYAVVGLVAAAAHEYIDRSDSALKERAEYLAKTPGAKAGDEPGMLTAKRYGAAAVAAVLVGLAGSMIV